MELSYSIQEQSGKWVHSGFSVVPLNQVDNIIRTLAKISVAVEGVQDFFITYRPIQPKPTEIVIPTKLRHFAEPLINSNTVF